MKSQVIDKEWEGSQRKMIEDYGKGYYPFSNRRDIMTIKVSEMINKYLRGKTCLDVGCGILETPEYMRECKNTTFIGIDPYGLEVKRSYDFVQGYAEELPFEAERFDGVLLISVIDHVNNPIVAEAEIRRVLKKGGILITRIKHYKKEGKIVRRLDEGASSIKLCDRPNMLSQEDIRGLFAHYDILEQLYVAENEMNITVYRKG